MKCPHCQHVNPAGAAFCGRCGGSLGSVSTCPDCGRENRIDHNFCSGCGARLAATALDGGGDPPSGPDPGLSSLVAELTTAAKRTERRQLTVAFCDLVGSTELSRKVDPEDLRHALRSFQETCSEVVNRFDGYIAQYLGDGVLIYFGYPLAHEDDPVRAISAALGIINELPRLNRRLEQRIGALKDRPLAVRIGVHTGLVVVGQVGGAGQAQELQAQGETPNIAARLQSAAQPDTVVMSETTRSLVTGVFIMEDLGELSVKGLGEPLRAYRAVQASGVRSRLDLAGAYGLTPLVGRQEELDLLIEYWRHVRQGEGQVMLLSGEAGVGKSRLVQTFRDRLSEDAHSWLECRCSPLYSQSAFSPVIDLIQQGLLISRGDSPETKLAKLETGLENAGFDLAESLPLFADLLSVPVGEGYQPVALSPEARRQKVLTALTRWLFVLAELQPVILVVEDLHWVDPSTMTLLESMMAQAPSSAVLMLLTFRTGFEPPSIRRSRDTRLSLKTLTPNQIRAMVSSMVGGKTLPREVLDELVAKTDGVPLFVEELTKMLLESDLLDERERHFELRAALPPLAIPATLQDSLTARLDHLAEAKGIAQVASVLGREFSFELLSAVAPLGKETLEAGLLRLIRAELLSMRGTMPAATFSFRHAMIQEAAYNSLLRSQRQELHQQVSNVLWDRFPEIAESHPEILARHSEAAGLVAEAIGYWYQAGQRAALRSANEEGRSHLLRGLELLQRLPESPMRSQQELALLMLLGLCLIATRGYGAEEVERIFAHSRELCQEIGQTPQLFPAVFGLWMFYQVRAAKKPAIELADELIAFAGGSGDRGLMVEAQGAKGITAFWQGQFVPARAHMTECLSLYDPEQDRGHLLLYGQDPAAFVHAYLALVLWSLGYPDQALKSHERAIEIATELGHPFTLVGPLWFGAVLRHYRREDEAFEALAGKTLALATEQAFPLWVGGAMGSMGRARVLRGEVEAGIADIQAGIEAVRQTGAQVTMPYHLACLAEARHAIGADDEALAAIDDGITAARKTLDGFCEPELHRIRGDILSARGDDLAAAESAYRRALRIAAKQHARSFELRAATGLARCLAGQGKDSLARSVLEPAHGWFTEGFGTADLREAEALLKTLS